MSGTVGLAAMPMPTTTVPRISETPTILRWVSLSAVRILALFMIDLLTWVDPTIPKPTPTSRTGGRLSPTERFP